MKAASNSVATRQRESTRDDGDDLSRNGAKFRRTGLWSERRLEFARDWRGIWLGVELEHWQKSSSCAERGEEGENAFIDMFTAMCFFASIAIALL